MYSLLKMARLSRTATISQVSNLSVAFIHIVTTSSGDISTAHQQNPPIYYKRIIDLETTNKCDCDLNTTIYYYGFGTLLSIVVRIPQYAACPLTAMVIGLLINLP